MFLTGVKEEVGDLGTHSGPGSSQQEMAGLSRETEAHISTVGHRGCWGCGEAAEVPPDLPMPEPTRASPALLVFMLGREVGGSGFSPALLLPGRV